MGIRSACRAFFSRSFPRKSKHCCSPRTYIVRNLSRRRRFIVRIPILDTHSPSPSLELPTIAHHLACFLIGDNHHGSNTIIFLKCLRRPKVRTAISRLFLFLPWGIHAVHVNRKT
jgi:hypothetical protein